MEQVLKEKLIKNEKTFPTNDIRHRKDDSVLSSMYFF